MTGAGLAASPDDNYSEGEQSVGVVASRGGTKLVWIEVDNGHAREDN